MRVNGDMITLAREWMALTQQQLADRAQVGQATVAKIEGGTISEVRDDVARRLAEALSFPEAFFSQPDQLMSFGSSALFYRKRATIPAADRKRIRSTVNLLRIALQRLLQVVEIEPTRELPVLDIDDFGGDAVAAARALRAAWQLPDGPLKNLAGLLESAGVVIISCDFGSRFIDGTSLRMAGMPPLVFVSTTIPSDRWRYTIAHELAHLVMHQVPRETMEAEADAFAAEFLMPAQDIKPDLMRLRAWSIQEMAQLKLFWRVSFRALVMRGRDLGVLRAEHAKRVFMMLSKLGVSEPVVFEPEEVDTYPRIVRSIRDGLGFGQEGLAEMLRWPTHLVSDLLPEPASPQRLRLVRN
jgi:Zn-dependent peptidase ImmA (M78 family)/ribosome-binding protein aMBF1 (putative translation factor)